MKRFSEWPEWARITGLMLMTFGAGLMLGATARFVWEIMLTFMCAFGGR